MWKQALLQWNTTGPVHWFLKTVSTSCWLSGSSWLIVIWPKQLNSPVFTETRTLNLQRTQVAQYYAPDRQRAAEFQLEGFAWREDFITGTPPEVFLPVLPSDGWRVLPADLQVCPPIWRAGGRLANTLQVTTIPEGQNWPQVKIDLENLRSRSWVRSNFKSIMWV